MSASALQLLGMVIAWLAVVFAAYAILGDWIVQRFKHRRRCPKCWYDMSHSPSLTCSECGFTAKRERTLFKGRRRWRLVWVALLQLMASHGARVTPAVRERGWLAAVPTTALILALPWIEPGTASMWAASGVTGPVPVDNLVDSLFLELYVNRLMKNALPQWQQACVIEKCLRGDRHHQPPFTAWTNTYGSVLHACEKFSNSWVSRAEALVSLQIDSRDAWPMDTPIFGRTFVARWRLDQFHHVSAVALAEGLVDIERTEPPMRFICGESGYFEGPQNWSDGLDCLGVVRRPAECLAYDLQARAGVPEFDRVDPLRRAVVSNSTLNVPIRIVPSIEEILQPMSSGDVTLTLLNELRPVLGIQRGNTNAILKLSDKANGLGWKVLELLPGTTFAIDAEILRDGKPVARALAWWQQDPQLRTFLPDPFWCNVRVSSTELARQSSPSAECAEWTLHITGDAVTALRNFRCNRYWSGDVSVPLKIQFK